MQIKETPRDEYRRLYRQELTEAHTMPCGDQDALGEIVDAARDRLLEAGGDPRAERRSVRAEVRR